MKPSVDLKALADAVLRRNNARNSRATTTGNDAQQTGTGTPPFVAYEIQELDRLIELVGKRHGFTEHDLREAREIARANVAEALTCFRALAKECGVNPHSCSG